jgi:hypothetical protein
MARTRLDAAVHMARTRLNGALFVFFHFHSLLFFAPGAPLEFCPLPFAPSLVFGTWRP